MSLPDFSLKGKVALITGARRGIGRAIALAYAEAGADIAICSLQGGSGLDAVADEVRRLGRSCLATQADVSRKADVDNLVRQVMARFDRIDVLVNNAGVALRAPFLEVTEADWDRVMDTDLKGYYLCAQAAGKVMAQQKKGVIINLASQRSFEFTPGNAVYCVAKAAEVMLTRVMALEMGAYGIRVNTLAPGLVKTDQSRVYWEDKEFLKQREARIPLSRVAETDDVIGAALFLASDASGYVTGHTILIDGGILA